MIFVSGGDFVLLLFCTGDIEIALRFQLFFCYHPPVTFSWDMEIIFLWLETNVTKQFDFDCGYRFWWIFGVGWLSMIVFLGDEDDF